MLDSLDRLRRQPKRLRLQVALWGSVLITIIVAVGWFFGMREQIQNKSERASQGVELQRGALEDFSSQVGGF